MGGYGDGAKLTDCAKGSLPRTCAGGSIYFGDTGTAATALAMCYKHVKNLPTHSRQATAFKAAMDKYWRYVVEGSLVAPPRRPANQTAPQGFVLRSGTDAGAIGCGYYGGH